jgi:cytochrome c-type biogenesis protein CcmH/NrfG
MSNTTAGRLDRIAFIILQIVLFITPVFFIPSASVPLQTGKTAFILYGIVIAFIIWAVARLKDGVFEAPRSLFYTSAGVFGLAYVLSAVFSANRAASFAGAGLELGSLSFVLPSLILFALIPLLVKSEKDLLRSYATLLLSFLLVALFQVIRLVFGVDVLDFGIFASATSNLLGKWNDLGIFFGLSAILSIITLERVSLSKVLRVLVYIAFFVSLVMLVIINFTSVWVMVALLSLVFIIYRLSFEKGGGTLGARIPYHALIALIISLLFLFVGGKIGGVIADSLGTSQFEVRPSWEATIDVTKESLKSDPVFGVGPNRFSSEWLMHKPQGINQTIFWNVGFNYGIGLIPSLIVSTGLVGFLSALLFIVLFALLAVKALFRRGSSPIIRYLVLSSLFASLYLWVFAIIYVPSASIWILTLVFSGLFGAALREDKVLAVKSYSTIDKPAASFISVLFVILALIAAVAFAYFVTVKFLASSYFQKGIITANKANGLDAGEKLVTRAIALSPSDVYYQSLTEIYVTRLNILFQDEKISQGEAQKQFQSLLTAAIQSAQAAVKIDPTNYQNHVSLGRVFETVVPLNIEGAYESAKKSYETALALSPESPEIYLMLARLEVAKKDNKAAKEYIVKAVEKKSDYADAIFLLSQIQISENDVASAINTVSAVATLRPTEPGIFFQLGILYYSSKDYQNAALALERAIALSPEYANARYFLGLSYYQQKQNDKAIAQFREIQKNNPDNAEVASILKNLEAGKPPFTGSSNAASRTTLPVRQ